MRAGLLAVAGRVAIVRGGAECELAGRQPRILLTLVATAPQHTVTRDQVVEALWGEAPPDTWQTSLRVTVSKVRAFLGSAGIEPSTLRTDADGYTLALGPDLEVGVETAERHIEAAERALELGQAEDAREAAEATRTLVAAPILAGEEGGWLENLRRQTRALLVRALEVEAEALTRLGKTVQAIRAATEAVRLEPYQESAHRALMRAQAAAGNKAEALRCFEACRRLLADELGVDPAPATQALHLRVLKDEEAIPPPAERRWKEVYEQLAGAGRSTPLSPRELEELGDAALWSGHHAESVDARQRAHIAYLEANDRRAAARVALALASNHGLRGQTAVAGGWVRTATRLLEGEQEVPEHGGIAVFSAIVAFEKGDLEQCQRSAERALEIGNRFDAPDLQALGILFRGLVLAHRQQLDDGLALLDEAMAVATSGRLSARATGMIYCRTIRTWLDLFDYRRAAEWIETIEQCSERTGFSGNAGDCSAHLAAALAARGTWTEAEQEASRACAEAARYEVSHVGLASVILGEICLRRGELTRAAAAFERANEIGVVPQPGIALLRLAQGDSAGALASIRAWLDGMPEALRRTRALTAAVEIAVAARDLDLAAAWARELESIAATFRSTALTAAAAGARGTVRLALAEGIAAARDLREAIDGYGRAELPYERARARALLAEALVQQGDRAGAVLELAAAKAAFSRLGAVPDARLAEERLRADASRPQVRPRRAQQR